VSDIATQSGSTEETKRRLTPGNSLLLAVVIVFGLLIVIGVGALIVGLFRTHDSADMPALAAAKPSKPVSMQLKPGFTILSSDTQPGRLVLHIRSASEDEIDIIDLNDGHLIGVIRAQAPR